MKLSLWIPLSALLVSSHLPASQMEKFAKCYESLIPQLRNRMHLSQVIGKGKTIFASGMRGNPSVYGLYVFDGKNLTFQQLPSIKTQADKAKYGNAIEVLESGKAQKIYLRIKHGEKEETTDFVIRKTSLFPATWAGEGTQGAFEDKQREGLPAHAEPVAVSKVDHTDALAAIAFEKAFMELLFAQKTFSNNAGRERAVEACLVDFPKGTTIGDAILETNKNVVGLAPVENTSPVNAVQESHDRETY